MEGPLNSFEGLLLTDSGFMGAMVQRFDWSTTLLGPIHKWPVTLKTAVSMCLNCKFATAVAWGDEQITIYNDAYSFLLSSKHPNALGKPLKDIWEEVWYTSGYHANNTKRLGISSIVTEHMFKVKIAEQTQSRYFTFCTYPIPTEDGKNIGGVLLQGTETTRPVVGERRLKLLRDLAARSVEAIHTEEACDIVEETLSNSEDVVFSLLYLVRSLEGENQLTLARKTNLPTESSLYIPSLIAGNLRNEDVGTKNVEFALLLSECVKTGRTKAMKISNSESTMIESGLQTCSIYPIFKTGNQTPIAVLVLGPCSYNLGDDEFYSFFDLIASQIEMTFNNAIAHEEERKRADSLADMDRAKTIFFSNISHELRTPLTLMLGPLEDLQSEDFQLQADAQKQIAMVYRNGLRLLKLVNTLLDFSKIEAGRIEAVFQPTDLSLLTVDLASIFRSACERVGLEFKVDCPSMDELVYVDNDMWEKIVLNLLSNAFKFTLHGSIEVKLREVGKCVVFTVKDTGSGIADEEVPHLFQRFNTMKSSFGRTHEGTGIGLALVNELVKLHGGSIYVTTKLGVGSEFKVIIPLGSDHLPSSQVRKETVVYPMTSRRDSSAYTKTVESWLSTLSKKSYDHQTNGNAMSRSPEALPMESLALDKESERTRYKTILIVDDNEDMREYLLRLCSKYYLVEEACDGKEAFSKLDDSIPDLIIVDIMMPKLNGFELVQQLRKDTRTNTLPIIFISARASEDFRIKGLRLGADDYIVKPFTAKELLARVKTHLHLADIRNAAARQAEAANKAKDHFLAVLSHELRTPLTPALMLAESLEQEKDLPNRIKDDILLISKNIKLEVRLIDDLLDVTRIAKEKLVLNFQTVDLHELIKHTVTLVQFDADEKKIKLHQILNATRHYVSGDSSRLEQILWNLVKNAVKFTPENGRVEIVTSNINDKVIKVDVIDTGIGIPSGSILKIFNSFEQGSYNVSQQFGGLGLGLSISRALTNMHQGTLTAQSEGEGKGSTFTLSLPSIEPLRISTESPPSPPLTPEKKKQQYNLLVVEDNKSTLLIMNRMLKRLGHLVRTASSVKEALDTAMKYKFDMVISDIGLPDGTGLDLMRELRSRKETSNIKGIAVSGYGMQEDLNKSTNAGFAMHLTKPIEFADLESGIRKVMSGNYVVFHKEEKT